MALDSSRFTEKTARYIHAVKVKKRIALLLPSLDAGGISQVMLNLAAEFQAEGLHVDLLPCRADGVHTQDISSGVHLVRLRPESMASSRLRLARLEPTAFSRLARPALFALNPSFTQRYLAALARYLAEARPDVLLSANTPTNLLALWARKLSGVSTRIAVSEHTHLSTQSVHIRKWGWRHVVPLVSHTYPLADRIVAVSNGVADDLAKIAGLPRETITTIYNPVVNRGLLTQANEPAPHPWLIDGGPPVIVAAGRFKPQKNFPLLLEAFARLRGQRPARLLILGEGKLRADMERLAGELGVAQHIAMPGFIRNPAAAFSRAAVFALSSDYEGLGNVLIEALACGCPVVSTDCPSGPREILQDGQFGELTPIDDASALADALSRTLDRPRQADRLRRRSQDFTSQASGAHYLRLFFHTTYAESVACAFQPDARL